MRAFDGQHSDRVSIKRTPEQKQRQLRELKDQFANLKSHASEALRSSMAKRIADLEQELARGGSAGSGASRPKRP